MNRLNAAVAATMVLTAIGFAADSKMSATGDYRLPENAYVVSEEPGYNSWPMIQAMGEKLLCSYSRDNARPANGHKISPGSRDSYLRISSDGGQHGQTHEAERRSNSE